MDSNSPSPKQEDNEPKAEFRKLTNEAANRKYRRRSPVAGSSDEEGSRKRERYLRGNPKVSDQERRNDDRLDEKSSSRSQRGDNADSYRHSSRSYHSRHDDYPKHGKYADDEDRIHAKSSSRSGRDSRGGTHSDRRDREGDYNRSRDHYKDVDRYSRDRSDADRKYKDKDLSSDRIGYDARHGSRYDDYDRHAGDRDHRDEKRDYRSSRGHRNDRTASFEDSRGHHSDSTPKREIDDLKDLDGSKYGQPGKNKNDGSDRHEPRHGGGGGGKFEDMSTFVGEDIAAKRPKLFSVEENDARKDEKPTLGSKQGQELVPKDTSEEAPVTGCHSASNLDAAKVAAIKAAELVNQNLVGTGFMTADQKKKLLWGSKKTSNTEESSRRWGTALFSDREQQEKFNKLMGVKGDVKADPRPASSQDVEKQRELQLDLEKQYTAGLRRRDGRTVGLGL